MSARGRRWRLRDSDRRRGAVRRLQESPGILRGRADAGLRGCHEVRTPEDVALGHGQGASLNVMPVPGREPSATPETPPEEAERPRSARNSLRGRGIWRTRRRHSGLPGGPGEPSPCWRLLPGPGGAGRVQGRYSARLAHPPPQPHRSEDGHGLRRYRLGEGRGANQGRRREEGVTPREPQPLGLPARTPYRPRESKGRRPCSARSTACASSTRPP